MSQNLPKRISVFSSESVADTVTITSDPIVIAGNYGSISLGIYLDGTVTIRYLLEALSGNFVQPGAGADEGGIVTSQVGSTAYFVIPITNPVYSDAMKIQVTGATGGAASTISIDLIIR